MADTDVKRHLRLPFDLDDALVDAAKEDQRSINGEVIWLLRQALAARPDKGD